MLYLVRMLRFQLRCRGAVRFAVPTLLSSSTRSASGKVLADRNIAVVLKDPTALSDLLEAVWNYRFDVIDTAVHVRRTIPAVSSDLAAAMTFDGFARLKDPAKDASSSVAVDFVRSVLEVQNRPKNYVPARARVHAVVEDHFEFVNTLNNAGAAKGQTQYAAFEKLSPVQVITICGYAPVCLDRAAFTAAALSANYSQPEIDAIVKAKTRHGKLWYEVDNLHREGNSVFIKIRPDIHNADGTTSKAVGKKEVRVVPAALPRAVELIRPRLAEPLDGAGITPSFMADYLSENLSWTFVYVPIIKASPAAPSRRLHDWAEFLTAEAAKDVPGLSTDRLFGRLLQEMSTLPLDFKGWAAEFDEVEQRALQAEAEMEAEKAAREAAEAQAAEAQSKAAEAQSKAAEAQAEVERLKALLAGRT